MSSIERDQHVDVIVIGSGLSVLAAAVEARGGGVGDRFRENECDRRQQHDQ